MADTVTIEFDDSAIKKFLRMIEIQGRDGRPVLKAFVAYHLRQILSVFRNEGKGFTPISSEYASPSSLPWRPFAPRSFGRKRPSGKKITQSSKLLQDTGTLRQSFKQITMGPTKVVWGSELSYAGKHQFGDARRGLPARPMIFMTREDKQMLVQLAANYIKDNILSVASGGAKA